MRRELEAEGRHALVFLSQPLQRANQALRQVEHYRALAQGVAFRYSHFLARQPGACGCQEDANDTANALVPFLGRAVGSQVAPPEGKGGKVGLLGHILSGLYISQKVVLDTYLTTPERTTKAPGPACPLLSCTTSEALQTTPPVRTSACIRNKRLIDTGIGITQNGKGVSRAFDFSC